MKIRALYILSKFFQTKRHPLTLGGHNFLILAQNQLLQRPTNALAQGATKLF